jgi:hypothetical protein
LALPQAGDLVYYQMPCEFKHMADRPVSLGAGYGVFGPVGYPSLAETAFRNPSALRGFTYTPGISVITFSGGDKPQAGVYAYFSVAGHPGFFSVHYASDNAAPVNYVDQGVRWCEFGTTTDSRVKTLGEDDDTKCKSLWTEISRNPQPSDLKICPRQPVPSTPNHSEGDYAGLIVNSNVEPRVIPYDVLSAGGICYASCPDIATNLSDLKRRLDDLSSGILNRLDALDKALTPTPPAAQDVAKPKQAPLPSPEVY